jgi:hypothetical protein
MLSHAGTNYGERGSYCDVVCAPRRIANRSAWVAERLGYFRRRATGSGRGGEVSRRGGAGARTDRSVGRRYGGGFGRSAAEGVDGLLCDHKTWCLTRSAMAARTVRDSRPTTATGSARSARRLATAQHERQRVPTVPRSARQVAHRGVGAARALDLARRRHGRCHGLCRADIAARPRRRFDTARLSNACSIQ